ncbi:hypothetical protein [Streptomyces sp. bgisy022]|uniref:hypothetical protein n=1 Tax=Streptomyces sp. bgisy022 TaxID=3413769 RepID=UPI003D75C371
MLSSLVTAFAVAVGTLLARWWTDTAVSTVGRETIDNALAIPPPAESAFDGTRFSGDRVPMRYVGFRGDRAVVDDGTLRPNRQTYDELIRPHLRNASTARTHAAHG